MTPERAKQLITNINFRSSNMTRGKPLPFPAETHVESKEVIRVWNTLESGDSTYYDALCVIARGD